MAAKVFGNFEQTQLYKMVRQEGLKGEESDSAKRLVEALSTYVEELGFNHVTEGLKKKELEDLVTPLKLEAPEKTTNKQVIRKRLVAAAKEEGLTDFFARKELTDDILNVFAEVAGVDTESSSGKKGLSKAIVKAVVETGLNVFFNRFDVAFLEDLMDSSKLRYDTNNQNALAHALATQSDAMKEKKSKAAAKTPKFSKTKKPLEKGITYQDIFQHYYSDELTKFCKENELKHSGPKKEVINRIIAFLDGDTESTKAGGSPKKRKRSSSASKKAKTTPKKKTTKKKADKEDKEDKEEKEEKEEKTKSPKKSSKKEDKEKENQEGESEETDSKKKKGTK